MNRLGHILLAILLWPLCGSGQQFTERWKKGTDCYLRKSFDSAAMYYEEIAKSKPQNAELYYNLGNTYYRLNRIAPAVLNYQRAINIDPDFKDAKENLAITQARISHHIPEIEDIFFIRWWKSVTANGNSTVWSVAALVSFLLIVAILWIRTLTRIHIRLPMQTPGILGFLCACFLLFAFVAAGRSGRSPGAVVNEDDAPLMNNSQKGKPLALVPEGVTVQVLNENGMWAEVRLPDGRTGWLLEAQISKI